LVRYRRHSGHGWTCRWVAPVANDPKQKSLLFEMESRGQLSCSACPVSGAPIFGFQATKT
jgi:hypothetical protein